GSWFAFDRSSSWQFEASSYTATPRSHPSSLLQHDARASSGHNHPKPQDLPPAVAHDQQTIEQSERDCRHDEEIHCGNAIRMVAKERLPSLRGRAPPPHHILGDAGLADLDAELEKLAMDSRRSPQRVGDAHLADQPANFQQYSWSAAAVPGFPAPIRSE